MQATGFERQRFSVSSQHLRDRTPEHSQSCVDTTVSWHCKQADSVEKKQKNDLAAHRAEERSLRYRTIKQGSREERRLRLLSRAARTQKTLLS